MRALTALLIVLFLAGSAEARWRLFKPRARHSVATTARPSVGLSGGPQSVAEAKAERAARLGIRGHQGGGFGGGSAEGIGFSTHSARAALNACCFTGTRVCIGQHVARGAGGWYAVKIFR